MEITEELITKAKEMKSTDELIAFAKENGKEITKEQAEKIYEQLHQNGEIADDELDNVAGGGCPSRPSMPEECPLYCSGWSVQCDNCQDPKTNYALCHVYRQWDRLSTPEG